MNPDITLPKEKFCRIYTALLTQIGTNPPTAIILQNTLGKQITWTRYTAGIYLGTIPGNFIITKTTANIVKNNADRGYTIQVQADRIVIYTSTGPTVGVDDALNNTLVEIKIYDL